MAYIGNKPANKAVVASDLDPAVITGQTALAVAPADTDEFLISDAGVLKRLDASLIGGGGITNAQQWRITTSFTGSATPISANWEEADTDGYNRLGTTMASVSGIFTFPSTGYWHITSTMTFISNGGGGSVGLQYGMNKLQTTTDNSTYDDAAGTYGSARVDTYYITTSGNFLFDVTDTSTHKVRLSVALSDSNATVMGDSNMNRTYLTFVRLGDT